MRNTVFASPPATMVVEEHNGAVCLVKVGHGTPMPLAVFLSDGAAEEYKRLFAMHSCHMHEMGRSGL